MRWAALAAVLLAVGASLGTHFVFGGSSAPEVPKAQKSAMLEQAKTDGVISGYRALPVGYAVNSGQIRLRRISLCDPQSAGGMGACNGPRPLIYIEYRAPAAQQAEAIWRIGQKQWPAADIRLFEVTPGLPNTHTPDARIMLIPKAGA
jgi:hypothetical protein